MSGHSRWSQIKRQKGAADVKKAKVYTKLGHAIALSVREGGKDPEMNVKLRLILDRAKAANMPNATIERAVKRGAGELEQGRTIESVVYEGFGPAGSAILVEAVTDNKNRTTNDVRHCFDEHGGSIGASGSVQWMFEPRGKIVLEETFLTPERELAVIDAGADDLKATEEGVAVLTKPDRLDAVRTALVVAGFSVIESDLTFVPKQPISPSSDAERERIESLIAALEAIDEVTNVCSNAT